MPSPTCISDRARGIALFPSFCRLAAPQRLSQSKFETVTDGANQNAVSALALIQSNSKKG